MSVGFGVDTWCTDTLKPGVLARGLVLVAQAIFGRLITKRGTLRGGEEESLYGFDIAGYVGAVGNAVALLALPELVKGEIMKDQRLAGANVTASFQESAEGVSIIIVISATLQDEGGDFTLTIGVNVVSAEILGLAA